MSPKNTFGIVKVLARYKRVLSIILFVAAVLNLFFFFLMPVLLRNFIVNKLTEKTGRESSLDRVNLNPYTLSLEAENLFIDEPGSGEVFFHSKSIRMDMAFMSVFRRAPVIRKLTIKRPYLNISRTETHYNFSDLLVKNNPDGRPLRFFIGNIKIENGRIVFNDIPKGKKHFVRSMEVSLPFVSNLPAFVNIHTAPSFSAEINGTPFAFEGRTKPFADSLETSFDIAIEKLPLSEYVDYVPVPLNFRLASAYLTANTHLSYVQPSAGDPSLIFKGALAFKDIRIDDMDKSPLLKIPRLNIDIGSIELFSRRAQVENITLSSPDIVLERGEDGRMNIASLLPAGAASSEKKQADKKAPFIFDINNIKLSEGTVAFTDKTPANHFNTELRSVELTLAELSNMEGKSARVSFSAESVRGETLVINGGLNLNPLSSQGAVELDRLALKEYAPYYDDLVMFRIAGGQGSLKTEFAYFAEGPKLSFSKGAVSLRDIRIDRKGGDAFLDIRKVAFMETDVDIMGKTINIGRALSEKIALKGTRMKDGAMDFLPLVKRRGEIEAPPEKKPSKDWVFTVKNMQMNESSVRIKDEMPAAYPAEISAEEITVTASNLGPATDRKSPVAFSFLLNGKSPVSSEGHLVMSPFSAELDIKAEKFPIISVQPYLSEHLNIIVSDGSVATGGKLALAQKDENLTLSYTGSTFISDFKSLDARDGGSFLNWSNLSLKQMSVGINPNLTAVEEISLQDLYASLVVYPDRTTNLQQVIKKTPEDSQNNDIAPVKKEELDVSTYIGKISLQNGRITFLDRSMEKEYFSSMDNITADIKGLSSIKEEAASVELKAMIDEHCTFLAEGRIQPLAGGFFLDITANLDGLDLTSATPYSEKYLGYTTRRGRLSFALDYLIEEKRLRSQNKFKFERLALGERVESPDATNLPVGFAIALLRDSSDTIRIDLPVSGSLDDPKFRIGPIILRMFINLIARAATSPFALLGSMFGGGENLSYLEFDYGLSSVTPENRRQLDILVDILKDRPALSLEIAGSVDREKDTESLRDIMFMRKVKMQKLKELVRTGEDSVSVDDIKMTDEEYERYLWLAYKSADFPRERNILGIVQQLPVPEMEELMLKHIEVSDSDLRLLATARGAAARDYLIGAGIPAERIFLLEPGTVKPEKVGDDIKASRANFQLK